MWGMNDLDFKNRLKILDNRNRADEKIIDSAIKDIKRLENILNHKINRERIVFFILGAFTYFIFREVLK